MTQRFFLFKFVYIYIPNRYESQTKIKMYGLSMIPFYFKFWKLNSNEKVIEIKWNYKKPIIYILAYRNTDGDNNIFWKIKSWLKNFKRMYIKSNFFLMNLKISKWIFSKSSYKTKFDKFLITKGINKAGELKIYRNDIQRRSQTKI